jgi:hypothetical protein
MGHIIGRGAIHLLLIALLGFAGCAGSSGQGTVKGTVTLDDQPLKEGVVRFVPVDGKSQTASADIKDGKFTAAVPLGEMQVEFSAPKVVNRRKAYDTPDSPLVDEVIELLPARFNVKSQLRITVKKGSQDETFPLQSK